MPIFFARSGALLYGGAAVILLAALPATASQHTRKSTTSKHKSSHAGASHSRAIDDARATEIQTALVKAGYLQTVSGHWDEESAQAMRKLQDDNGWQTKLIPDSRALIKLGLGPKSDASYSTVNAFTELSAEGPSEPNGGAASASHADPVASQQ